MLRSLKFMVILILYFTSCIGALIIPGIGLELKHSINKNPYYKEILHTYNESKDNFTFSPLDSEFLIINSKLLKDLKTLNSLGFDENQNKSYAINSTNAASNVKKLQFPELFNDEEQDKEETNLKKNKNFIYLPFESNVMFIFNSLESPTVQLSDLSNISTLQQFAPPFRIQKYVRMSDFYLLLNKNYLSQKAFSNFDKLHSKLMTGPNLVAGLWKIQRNLKDRNTRMPQLNLLDSFSNVTKPLFVIQFESFDDRNLLNTTLEERKKNSDYIDTTLLNYNDMFNAHQRLTYFDALSKALISNLGISSLAKAEFCSLNINADQEYCLSVDSKSIQISPISRREIFKRDINDDFSLDPLNERTDGHFEELISASMAPNEDNNRDLLDISNNDHSSEESRNQILNYKPKFNPALFSGNYLDSFMNFEKKKYKNTSFANSDYIDKFVNEYSANTNNEGNINNDEFKNQKKDYLEEAGKSEFNKEINQDNIKLNHTDLIETRIFSKTNNSKNDEEDNLIKRDLNYNHIEIDLAKLLQNIHASKNSISKSLGIPQTNSTNIDINTVRQSLINQYSATYDRLVKGLLSQKTFGVDITKNDCENDDCKKLNNILFSFTEPSTNLKRSFEDPKKCLDITWTNVFSINTILGDDMICKEK